MKKRINKIDYSILSDIEIWELVKSKKITRFPPDFWSKESFKNILRYLLLELYNYSREDICRINLKHFLRQECILTPTKIFNNSSFAILSYCFPELDIKEWEMILVPKKFWNDENTKRAINWLCEKENLKTRQQIISKLTCNLLKKNNLATITLKYSMKELLDLCFPEFDIKVWELSKVMVWSDELAHEAIQWFLKKENLLTREEICKRFSGNLLEKNGLTGMLCCKFDYSSIKVLEFEFPGQYKKEDLKAYQNYV